MAWVRIDDQFPRHRRVRELRRDVAAKWLHVVALCHCGEHLTDGYIDELALEQIINDAGVPASTAHRCIPKLVGAGLWVELDTEGGYLIRDYLDYNPARRDVKEKRERASERMRSLRTRRSREQNANTTRSSQPPAPTPKEQEQDQVLYAREAVTRSLQGAA